MTDRSDPAAGLPGATPVTVVVATRDRPELLRRCVAGILGQEYPGAIECIVVFDQSEPQTIDVTVSDNRLLRTMRNERTPGLPGARNTGVLTATSELVAFCDDDDEWLPGKIARQTELLRQHPEAVAAGCAVILEQEGSDIIKPSPPSVSYDDLLRSRVWELHPSTVLAWRSMVLDQVGLVDECIPGGYAEDYEWLLRVAAVAPIPMAPEPLVRIRWHQASYFARKWLMIAEALSYLLDKHPDFQRDSRGRARIRGQIAFAFAAAGRARNARSAAVGALRDSARERRAYLALLVSFRLLSPDFVLRQAHARGRGI